MEKRLVILIPLQPLLGEGLQRIFQKLEDVELISLSCADLEKIDACLINTYPDMVLLAGEKEDDTATLLISKILKHFEDIPIVWVGLETNSLHLYTSHSMTASSSELIRTIRESDAHKIVTIPTEKK
jgi:hypothetical protein